MIKIEFRDDKRVVEIVPGSTAHHLLQGLHDAMTVSKLTTPELKGWVVIQTLQALDLDTPLMTYKVMLWFSDHRYVKYKSYKDTSIWVFTRKGEFLLGRLNNGKNQVLESKWEH